MKEQLVKLTTAMLAFERMFEEPCRYASEDGIDMEDGLDMTGDIYITIDDIRDAWDNDYQVYLFPTQSLLQKWLRENHNIGIEVKHLTSTSYDFNLYRITDKGCSYMSLEYSTYISYEEALEQALFIVLKIIK